MYTIDETQDTLETAAARIPEEFYEGLNGGISLLPQVKRSPHSRPEKPLYIMGEYRNSLSMGRYIVIYYGSFRRVFGHLDREEYAEELYKTLKHEFWHHLEGKAGTRDLEHEDARKIQSLLKDLPADSKPRISRRHPEDLNETAAPDRAARPESDSLRSHWRAGDKPGNDERG